MTAPDARPPEGQFDDAPRRQARNSAAFWIATAQSRGHQVIRERGFVAVVGDERAGTRVLIQEPDLDAGERAAITTLARRASGPVDLEDPYSAAALEHLGLRHWQMPVMARPPGPVAAADPTAWRVRDASDLPLAERVVIESFGLTRFEPHRAGELFPPSLIEQPGVAVYLFTVDGDAAGACVTVVADGYGSHYWVGTSETYRSRGVGRRVMLASLADLADLPVTLTASRLGRPLYESLGYHVAGMATWYSST